MEDAGYHAENAADVRHALALRVHPAGADFLHVGISHDPSHDAANGADYQPHHQAQDTHDQDQHATVRGHAPAAAPPAAAAAVVVIIVKIFIAPRWAAFGGRLFR